MWTQTGINESMALEEDHFFLEELCKGNLQQTSEISIRLQDGK